MSQDASPDTEHICACCFKEILDSAYVEALNGEWHQQCFRCSQCEKCLSNWYFEKNGKLYCRKDYWSLFGESCNRCSEVITGPVMVAGEHKYHPECFQCVSCAAFIGDGDTYILVERSKLFCGKCYKSLMKPVLSPGRRGRRKPHSIQLVEIPPSPEGNYGLQYTLEQDHTGPRTSRNNATNSACLKISELAESPELDTLQIGDRILEVNGISVKDNSVDKIDMILQNNNCKDVLHLTVERDPSPLPSSSSALLTPKKPSIADSGSLSSPEMVSDSGVQRRQKSTLKARNFSPSRRRSKSPSPVPPSRKSLDLSRAHSFKQQPKSHRVFRTTDLVQGEILGTGFFGNAYKVKHRVTGEVMVLKEMNSFDEQTQKTFLKEVSVLRSLNHPNVLHFMGVLYKGNKLNIITEYMSGGTLKDLLHDMSKPLSWETRIHFTRDIADGMNYLHKMDIIHRDLNSQNCFVKKDLTIVVADFGLARVIPDQNYRRALPSKSASSKSTSKKRFQRKKRYTVVGSPYWMAPEMLSGEIYDEKVDLFSFGIVMCEIIGRILADPDYLPRTIDFGLNAEAFYKKFCSDCPDPFFKIAIMCCQMTADNRPNFEQVGMWFDGILFHLENGGTVPADLKGDPLEFYFSLKDTIHPHGPDKTDNTETSKSKTKKTSLNPIPEKKKHIDVSDIGTDELSRELSECTSDSGMVSDITMETTNTSKPSCCKQLTEISNGVSSLASEELAVSDLTSENLMIQSRPETKPFEFVISDHSSEDCLAELSNGDLVQASDLSADSSISPHVAAAEVVCENSQQSVMMNDEQSEDNPHCDSIGYRADCESEKSDMETSEVSRRPSFVSTCVIELSPVKSSHDNSTNDDSAKCSQTFPAVSPISINCRNSKPNQDKSLSQDHLSSTPISSSCSNGITPCLTSPSSPISLNIIDDDIKCSCDLDSCSDSKSCTCFLTMETSKSCKNLFSMTNSNCPLSFTDSFNQISATDTKAKDFPSGIQILDKSC